MPDCFISYSNADSDLADYIYNLLSLQKVNAYKASVSLQPGQDWPKEVRNNLQQSELVVFLASEDSCNSPYVQQELGAALATEKRIIPIVWNMDPIRLPGWINQKQALDLRNKDMNEVVLAIKNIGDYIGKKKNQELLILMTVGIGLILLLGSD